MALAIFDLDETLISADSDHEWGQFVVDRGLVDGEEHKRKNDSFYAQYKLGQLDITEYLRFSCSVLARYSLEELEAYLAEFVDLRIKPLILARGESLVAKHRDRGDHLLVVTSTIEFITRPIADLLGIATLIAPVPEIIDDRYTGEIVGVPSFAEGKVTRLQQWLDDTGHSMKGSYFYSDSHNDLPLLTIVDHPVAVDPDETLKREAKANQWQIISLRD